MAGFGGAAATIERVGVCGGKKSTGGFHVAFFLYMVIDTQEGVHGALWLSSARARRFFLPSFSLPRLARLRLDTTVDLGSRAHHLSRSRPVLRPLASDAAVASCSLSDGTGPSGIQGHGDPFRLAQDALFCWCRCRGPTLDTTPPPPGMKGVPLNASQWQVQHGRQRCGHCVFFRGGGLLIPACRPTSQMAATR